MIPTPRNHTQDTTAPAEHEAPAVAVSRVCWGCGSNPHREGERLCWECTRAGIDPHWIPCTTEHHDHVARRTWRGQQTFTCRGENR